MLQTDNENLAEPWPYSRRSGSGIDADIAALLAPAAISLTEQEHDEVAAFNKTLLSGALTEINKPLEAVDKISLLSRTATFYNGYFATSEAAGKVVNQDDLYQKVATGDEVETTSLGTIAEASAKWHREAITADLGTSAQFEQNPPLDSTVTRVNFDPAATINKFSQLQHFRMAYRAVRQTLNEADGPTTEAKSTLLDVQVGRANAMTALLYPHMLELAEQLAVSPPTELVADWRNKLFEAAPVLRYADRQNAGLELQASHDRFAKRLDLVRNGAEATYDEAGNASPLSVAILQHSDVVEITYRKQQAPDRLEGKLPHEFTQEQVETIKNTEWQADDLHEFLQSILGKWDLLSSHPISWVEYKKRNGPADDGLWQVVLRNGSGGLSVSANKKAMVVGSDFKRKLLQLSPAGGLPVAAHELGHVLQAEANAALAQNLPVAELGGRQKIVMEELGGIRFEKQVFAAFDLDREANTTYLRALETKLAGGNETAVVGAFFEAKMLQPQAEAGKAREAARAALRLYRHHGHNSQPLNYLEQDLILNQLEASMSPGQLDVLAIHGSAFSLPDTAKLHQVGLLEMPSAITRNPAQAVIETYAEYCV